MPHEYSKGTINFKKQEKMGKNFFSQEWNFESQIF